LALLRQPGPEWTDIQFLAIHQAFDGDQLLIVQKEPVLGNDDDGRGDGRIVRRGIRLPQIFGNGYDLSFRRIAFQEEHQEDRKHVDHRGEPEL